MLQLVLQTPFFLYPLDMPGGKEKHGKAFIIVRANYNRKGINSWQQFQEYRHDARPVTDHNFKRGQE
jgi:hypothetical protein